MDQIVHVERSSKDVWDLLNAISDVVNKFDPATAYIAGLTLAVHVQRPDLSQAKLVEAVEDVSNYMSLSLIADQVGGVAN